MVVHNLYNAICRGKWLISLQEVSANLLLVEKLLSHDSSLDKEVKLSEKTPVPVVFAKEGKSMKPGNAFKDAPEGSTAIIPVYGTMLKFGTMCNYGTSEIASVIREAADSENISSLVLDMDSGGGSVDAIAPLLDAVNYAQGKQKAVVAFCDLCASAAYYVACSCNEIIAGNEVSSELGSIGVMISFMDYTKYYEDKGIKQHTIYSNLSDYKNLPFEAAKKGDYKAIREEELDPLARDFQEAVKRSRGEKLKLETEGLLKGRMFYAKEAIRVGLADRIGTIEQAISRSRELSEEMAVNDYLNSKK